MSEKSSVEDLKQSVIGIVSTVGNLNSGLSNFLNGRQPYLKSDYKKAVSLPDYYDTDIENFWTNPSKFGLGRGGARPP
jgi:hypothetical protein